MHQYCPRDHAVLLVAILDPSGILRFPRSSSAEPGILFKVPGLVPIADLLRQRLMPLLSAMPDAQAIFEIVDDFEHDFNLQSGEKACLYLARLNLDKNFESPGMKFDSLPNLLRATSDSTNRQALLKTLQIFSGASKEQTKVIESEDLN